MQQPGMTSPQGMRNCGPNEFPTQNNPCFMAQPTDTYPPGTTPTSTQPFFQPQFTTQPDITTMPICGPGIQGPCRTSAGTQPGMTGQPGMPGQPGMQSPMPTFMPQQVEQLRCQSPGGFFDYAPSRAFDPEENVEVQITSCPQWEQFKAKQEQYFQRMRGSGNQGQFPGMGQFPGAPGQFPGMTGQFPGANMFPGQGQAQGMGQFPFSSGFSTTQQSGQAGGPEGGRGRGQATPMEFMPTFDCARDFNNPFCRTGNTGSREFEQMQNMFENVDTSKVKLKSNLGSEIKRLKAEAVLKEKFVYDPANPWKSPSECGFMGGPGPMPMEAQGGFGFGGPGMPNVMPQGPRPMECDIVEATRQLNEDVVVSGVACPVGVQIKAVIDQAQTVFDEIRALDASTATADQIKQVWAKFDSLRGDPGRRREGILSKLHGAYDEQTRKQKPGLMQGLDSCRQVGQLMRESGRELNNFKHMSDTDEYKALADFAANPLKYLPEGVDIFSWEPPDMRKCGGPGPGPMPMGPDFEGGPRGRGPGGPPEMGPPEGFECKFIEPPFMPNEECMPPVMKYLGMPHGKMKDLIKGLVEKSCTVEQKKQNQWACKAFEDAPTELARNRDKLPDAVAQKAQSLIDSGEAACQAEDNEEAAGLFKDMMQLVMPFMRGQVKLVKPNQDMVDDIKDRKNLGDQEESQLKREIASLKDELMGMNQKFQDLMAETIKLKNALGAAKEALVSLDLTKEQLSKLASNASTSEIGRELIARNEKIMAYANEVASNLPRTAKTELAEAVEFTLEGLSSEAEQDVKEKFDTLSAKVNSGLLNDQAKLKEVQSFKEKIKEIVESPEEKDKQLEEGVIAFKDVSAKHWAYDESQIAAKEGLASTRNKDVGVAAPETYNQAVVRVVRLAGKTLSEDFSDLDSNDPESVRLIKEFPGVEPWARPFLAACQEAGVKDCLQPPVKNFKEAIEREEMASLVVNTLEAAGVDLPSPASVPVPPDVSPEFVPEVRTAIAAGFMGGATGPTDPNFGGSQTLNVGMDLVVAVKVNEFIRALSTEALSAEEVQAPSSEEVSEMNPLPSPGPSSSLTEEEEEEFIDFDDFTEGEED